jgi:hypothetical protein
MSGPTKFVPLQDLLSAAWPHALGTAPDIGSFLNNFGAAGMSISRDAATGLPNGATFQLAVLAQATLDLPILPGFQLQTGIAGGTITSFTATVRTSPHLTVAIDNLPVTLYLPPSIMQEWTKTGTSWAPSLDANGNPKGFGFTLNTGITIDLDAETIALDDPTISVATPGAGAMIGNTGVIVTMSGLQLVLSNDPPTGHSYPAGTPAGFRGIVFANATATYQSDASTLPLDGGGAATLQLNNCAIGSGGFTGQIQLTLPPAADKDTLPGGTLFGIDCRLQSFSITFASSIPTACSIQAYLQIPFFSDPGTAADWLSVNASIGGPDGELLVQLSDTSGNLVDLNRPGLLDLQISGLSFELIDGVPGISITGTLQPLIPGFTWPVFGLNGLKVDSQGHVQLPGGILKLPSAAYIDLSGFAVEIEAIGFGTFQENGTTRQFFGFSGGIKLTDDLAGAEVNNLRVSWPQGIAVASIPSKLEVTLDGISIDLMIDGVLSLQGSVEFNRSQSEFSGDLTLTLEVPFEATLGVAFVVGQSPSGYKYWFLDALLDLPVGIPLADTGIAVYGGEALVGQNWAPTKTPQQDWFEDWYLGGPEVGLGVSPPANPTDKWGPQNGSWVFGGGIVLGTLPDDGFSFAAKVLIVITIPGPVIFIEGRAQFLEDRSDIDSGAQPPFRALAVLDFENDEFEFAVTANYSIADIIDISASAEAYFNLQDPSAWHLYLGEDTPQSKRIQATVLSIVQAGSFFMLDARSLNTGASVSWGVDLSIGPLGIHVHALFEEQVQIFWQPFQLAGQVHLAGDIGISAFGVGISISLDAKLGAQAPQPFEVSGSVHVSLSLPWPLPSPSADVSFSWEQAATPNYWVDPLNSITLISPLSVVSTSWTPASGVGPGPTVPLDAHAVLTFGRPVNPGTSVAGIPPATSVAQPGTLGFTGEQLPGVPGNFVSSLTSVTLEIFDGSAWQTVAQTQDPSQPWNGTVNLQTAVWGTWGNLKDRNGDWAALQFEMNNRYAFSQTSDLGSQYLGGSVQQFGEQLCNLAPPPRRTCTSYRDQTPGTIYGPVFVHSPGRLTTSRTVGIAARNSATFPVVLFLQARTRATLALDLPSVLLDVDIVPHGEVTLTTYSGSTQLQRHTFTAAAVAHFTAAAATPITHLRFDTVGLSTIDRTPPYENDGILYGGATTSPAPLRDCVTLVEDAIIALLWPPAGGSGAAVKVLISQLRECSGAKDCAAEVRRFAAAVTAFEAAANIVVQGNHRCQAFRAVALAAEALTACILSNGAAGCAQLAATALAAEKRTLEAALLYACTGSAAVAAEFRSLLVTARLDRALFEMCGTTKADENGMPIGIGDPSDTSLWLSQIPGLAASTATTAGCNVRRICWLTPDEAAYSALAIQAEETFQSLVEQSSADVPLFVPHSQYRLTVLTGQTNSSVSGSPQSWTHQVFFQTSGPPGDYIQGDPLDNLDLYVETSIPADGSVGTYANYGVGVTWNQSYVDGMYTGLGEDLVLHLYGADGQPVTDTNGNPVVFANPWSAATSTTLQTYQTLLGILAPSSTCNLPPIVYQSDSQSSSPLPADVTLLPQTRYTVQVMAGATGSEREVYSFSFTTGRYADFASQIARARAVGPILTNAAASSALSVPTTLLAQAPYNSATEDVAFQSALAALDLAPRTVPPETIASLITVGAKNPLLLLELDQPVDIRRVGVTLYTDPDDGSAPPAAGAALAATLAARGDAITACVLRSADGSSMLIGAADLRDLTGMRVSLLFTYAFFLPGSPTLIYGSASNEQAGAAFRFVAVGTGGH